MTEAAGVDFLHQNGASDHRLLPETMGAGLAFFDYDGDGLPDLYLANGGPAVPGHPSPAPGTLYRNLGDGRFRDVTAAAGLADVAFPGMGTAVGDLEGDGDLDLFVTGVGGDHLFVNRGDGTFEERADRLGEVDPGFGTSAAFLDFDRDGHLDLFAGRYVVWSPDGDIPCRPDGEHRSYCTPEVYEGASNRLYRNLGDGRFRDVTAAAGVDEPEGKTLGVVPLDHDRDGWPDLAVANDTVRNFLFLNRRDGTFREVGVEVGAAFGASGAPRGGMGIDAGDLDADGLPDLVIGNFGQEMPALFRAVREGLFVDDAAQVGIGLPSLMTLAFGTLIFDFDSDGYLDVLLANGHIEPGIARFQPLQSYAQPLQLFRRIPGAWRFEEVEGRPGGPLTRSWVGRGLATADLDGDGDLDLGLTQNGAPARLLRNDTPTRRWLRLALVGRSSSRTPYGAEVIAVAGERRINRTLASGRSYLSACEPVVTLGLGDLDHLDAVEIAWPSGKVLRLVRPPLDRVLEVEEPAG